MQTTVNPLYTVLSWMSSWVVFLDSYAYPVLTSLNALSQFLGRHRRDEMEKTLKLRLYILKKHNQNPSLDFSKPIQSHEQMLSAVKTDKARAKIAYLQAADLLLFRNKDTPVARGCSLISRLFSFHHLGSFPEKTLKGRCMTVLQAMSIGGEMAKLSAVLGYTNKHSPTYKKVHVLSSFANWSFLFLLFHQLGSAAYQSVKSDPK